MRTFQDDPDAAEVFVLTCGTDTEEADVRSWRATTDFATVGVVVDHILELSGLTGTPDPKS